MLLTMNRVTAALLMAGVIFALSACQNESTGFKRPSNGGSPNAAPSSFLESGYGPLEEWLSERFDVTYRNMKLGGTEKENIFAQQPLTEIYYEFEDVGRSGALFHLQAKNISRREILYKIARHYDLRMTVENVNGKPAFVRIVGSSPGSRFNPGESYVDEGAVREF